MDNPHLDTAEYEQSLSELDPLTRAQLLRGDWSATKPGSKFRREWFPIVDDFPRICRLIRFWDLAATEPKPGADPDWTVGALVGERGGQYWLINIQRTRSTPGGVEALIRQTAQQDGPLVDIAIEQEPGSAGIALVSHYQRHVLPGFSVRGHRPTGPKEVRANPVSSAAEASNVSLVQAPWITAFLDEAEGFPGGAHDDQVDALSGAVAMLAAQNQLFRSEDIAAAVSKDVTPLFATSNEGTLVSTSVNPLFSEA